VGLRSGLVTLAMLPVLAHAAELHLEVTGVDVPDGGTTVATAWRTFDFAIPRLKAGDTLWVGDGTWTRADGGLLSAACMAGNAAQGQAGAPITVKAVNRARAHLASDGIDNGLTLYQCSFWNVDGLHVSVADNSAGSGGEAVTVSRSTDVVLSHLLVQGNNRARNNHGIDAYLSQRVTIEENEVYDVSRVGILLFDSDDSVARRNYVNSRDRADGTYVSTFPARGDVGIDAQGNNLVVENNISEHNAVAFFADTYGGGTGVTFTGNVSLDDYYGGFVSKEQGAQRQGTRFLDHIAVRPTLVGTYFRSGLDSVCTRCSFFETAREGFAADRLQGDLSTVSAYLRSSFATTQLDASYGLYVTGQDTFEVTDVITSGYQAVAFPGGPGFGADAGDPRMGGCYVAPPPDGGVLGSDGGRIGATVLYRTIDGGLTSQPLWDPSTGAFPGCGPIVAGVNDDPATACSGVHLRLRVGTPQCPLPFASTPDAGTPDAGISDGGSSDAGATDAGASDGGSADGGASDGGSADAGAADAGDAGSTDQDGGVPDGGTFGPQRPLAVQCGCGASEAAPLLSLAALAQWLRGAKRPRRSERARGAAAAQKF